MIDEADRIMDEIKQDWLTQVENAVFTRDRNMEQNAKDTTRTPFERSLPGPNTAAKYTFILIMLHKNIRYIVNKTTGIKLINYM